MQWITVLFTHITIAVSQKTADQILAFPFVSKDRVKVIHNGEADIDFVDRAEARQTLLGDKNVIDRTIWIGTTSELHPNKGIDIALTAFAEVVKKYPRTIYVIIGDGKEKYRLIRQAARLGLSNQVFFMGFVPDAKKYLKAFDIFTLTSRTEALPYSILEAGLAGLPVVASAVGGIPEIITSAETGFLVPAGKKAPQAIASALEKFITNPEHAKTIGQNLRRRVIQEFSQQKMLNETFAVYSE